MRETINTILSAIEQQEQVRILYACESGIRAWGFESAASDYDVRFLYARPREAYLQLDIPRDVIERPLDSNLLDVSGWDIFKALRLLRKCNPPLLEWLFSPIVYRELVPSLTSLRIYASHCYGTMAVEEHYFHMAQGNYRQYIQSKTPVLRKKYLYAIRPLLMLMHLRQNFQTRGYMPPVNMLALLEGVDLPADIRQRILRLVAQKQEGEELGIGQPDDALNAFIENMFVRFPRIKEQQPAPDLNLALHGMLRRVLDEGSQ